MSRGLSALDRVVVAIVALLLIATGVWAVGFFLDVPYAHEIGAWYDEAKLQAFLTSRWYPVTLILVATAIIVLVPWWLVANLRPRSFNRMTSAKQSAAGNITVATTQVAEAAAKELREYDHVTGVQRTTRMDRQRPTMSWTIHATPEINLAELTRQIEQTDEDVHGALPDFDVDTRYLLRLGPVTAD